MRLIGLATFDETVSSSPASALILRRATVRAVSYSLAMLVALEDQPKEPSQRQYAEDEQQRQDRDSIPWTRVVCVRLRDLTHIRVEGRGPVRELIMYISKDDVRDRFVHIVQRSLIKGDISVIGIVSKSSIYGCVDICYDVLVEGFAYCLLNRGIDRACNILLEADECLAEVHKFVFDHILDSFLDLNTHHLGEVIRNRFVQAD